MSNNGQLPQSELSPILNGELRTDAAASWNAMNVEARSKGCELRPTGSKSSYRTLDQQNELYAIYLAGGNLAAKPGTSNHGWGLAVDVATQEMRSMIDQIGEKYGWSKKTSDAQSEWWHIKWVEGSWKGSDPGPLGLGSNSPEQPEDTMAIVVATMKDGRFELFVEKSDGSIWHTWQDKAGGWVGAEKGKRPAAWSPLGTPGK